MAAEPLRTIGASFGGNNDRLTTGGLTCERQEALEDTQAARGVDQAWVTALLESEPESAILLVDRGGRVLRAWLGRAVAASLGDGARWMRPVAWWSCLDDDARAEAMDATLNALVMGRSSCGVWSLRGKDHAPQCEARILALRGENASGWPVVVMLREVGVQRAEPAAAPEPWHAATSILDQLAIPILIMRRGQALFWNREAKRLLGADPADLPDQNYMELVAPWCRDRAVAFRKRALAGEPMLGRLDIDLVPRGGTPIAVEVLQHTIVLEGERATAVVLRDVTEQRRTEQGLRESEARYRTIVDTTHDLVWIHGQDGGMLFCNRRVDELTGHDWNEWRGRPLADLVEPESQVATRRALRDALRGEPQTYEMAIRDRHGEKKVLLTNKVPLYENGSIVGAINIARDITELKRAQAALAAEKERLAVTLGSLKEGVIGTDTQGRVTLMNAAAEQLTGWTATTAVGRPLSDVLELLEARTRELVGCPTRHAFVANDEAGEATQRILISRDGTERQVENSVAAIRRSDGTIRGIALVLRDVTEQRRVQEELFRAQRLESLGVLAGGIAHDFNNILTAVIGSLNLAEVHPNDVEMQQEDLRRARSAAMRAKDLTRQLLTFSQGGTPLKKPASIRELVQETAAFAMRGSNVRCDLQFPPEPWTVEVDEGQISQVLHNLLINADQAMPQGGVIRVSVENLTVRAPALRNDIRVQPGRYIEITVEDEGAGIAPENLDRVFDPCFTTKSTGNGLGLTTAHAIIRRHGGNITVRSSPGVGTTFTLLLPASKKAVSQEPRPSDSCDPVPCRVLLMDDDGFVLQVAESMLKHFGCETVVARDGQEAVLAVHEELSKGSRFDAVVMDLTIPGGLGGRQAAEQLRALDANLKLIVSSGYCNDPILANHTEFGFDAVLPKPYDIGQLHDVLRRTLAQGDPQR